MMHPTPLLQTFAITCRTTLAWCVVFAIVRNALPYRSIDFQNRCVSLLHALEAIVFCCMVVRDWHHPLGPVGQATNTQEVVVEVQVCSSKCSHHHHIPCPMVHPAHSGGASWSASATLHTICFIACSLKRALPMRCTMQEPSWGCWWECLHAR